MIKENEIKVLLKVCILVFVLKFFNLRRIPSFGYNYSNVEMYILIGVKMILMYWLNNDVLYLIENNKKYIIPYFVFLFNMVMWRMNFFTSSRVQGEVMHAGEEFYETIIGLAFLTIFWNFLLSSFNHIF